MMKLTTLLVCVLLIFICSTGNGQNKFNYDTALIAYKNSPHKWVVGYFTELDKTGEAGKEYTNLRTVPDSLDMVVLFGNMNHNNEKLWAKAAYVKADIAYLHSKGIKVYNDVWLTDFDSYKYSDGSSFKHTVADYDSFAHRVYTYFLEWEIDGIALDFEPGMVYTPAKNIGLAKAFAKYFGLQSATGKGLILDTDRSVEQLNSTMGLSAKFINANVNYVWIMDYSGQLSSTNKKIDSYISNGYSVSRIMQIGADFESDYNSNTAALGPPRLKSMYTSPSILNKVSGFGAYGFNHDQTQNYKCYRKMMQLLNPVSSSTNANKNSGQRK